MQEPETTLISQSEAEDPFAGTPYRKVRGLGQGGMGEVVEVEHVALGKRVVAKLLKAPLAEDPAMLERFRFEAQALARLTHPNLVEVFDLGCTRRGQPYFTMERLRGRTLTEELRARGRLPVAEAIEIAVQVLAGLGAAHEHGMVHRDVKLDNIFLCDPGAAGDPPGSPPVRRVKVLDFGVAKARRGGEQIAKAPAYATEEGTVMGTPRFIAPEQIHGRGVDARADVYATGVLLYNLVAGRGPFALPPGLSPVQAQLAFVRAHLHEPPKPPSQWGPLPLPPALDAAVLRALAKRPEDRFASVAAFANELERIRAALPAEERQAASDHGAPVAASSSAGRDLAAGAVPSAAAGATIDPQAEARSRLREVLLVAGASAIGFFLLLLWLGRLLGVVR